MDEGALKEIRVQLIAGRIVPFIGSGASLTGEPAAPSAAELAARIAFRATFPDSHGTGLDLARVASFYDARFGRDPLNGALRAELGHDWQPGPIHRFLAEIGEKLLVVTTNYDDLLEQAFRDAGRAPHLVYHPYDDPDRKGVVLWQRPGEDDFEEIAPQDLVLPIGQEPIIYKMHGHCDEDDQKGESFLVTEEDYVGFLAEMPVPPSILRKLRKATILFLGYGLRDWNVRVLLHNFRSAGRGQAFAVQKAPDPVDALLWDARKVDIVEMELDAFVDALKATA